MQSLHSIQSKDERQKVGKKEDREKLRALQQCTYRLSLVNDSYLRGLRCSQAYDWPMLRLCNAQPDHVRPGCTTFFFRRKGHTKASAKGEAANSVWHGRKGHERKLEY